MAIENFRDRSVWFKEGREEGRKEAQQEALRRGAMVYARAAIERVLAKRGMPANEALCARLSACEDHATLDRWLEAAAVSISAEEALS